MRYGRLVAIAWWLQLKIRSRSAFDGLLSLLWPLFFATAIFLMFRAGTASGSALLSAAIGASVMGVWSAVSTSASFSLQQERRQGTLELLVAAPTPLPLLILPITLSMATIGAYSLVACLLWGRFVFGIPIVVASPVAFVAAVAVTVVSIGVFGFLIAISTIRYRSAWALGSALEQPIWLICGFVVPLALLPSWAQPIAWVLSPTWGMAAVRAAAEGRSPLRDIALCLALTVVYAVVGTLVAQWAVHSARTHATLALS